MVNRLLLAAAAFAIAADPAVSSEFDDVHLEVVPQLTSGAAPYPREMVILKVRGAYRPLVLREKLIQPPFVNFAWSELGRDEMGVGEANGFPVRLFERSVAVFPDRPGRLTIDSFVHKLTVVDGTGSREINVRSAPITLDVATWQGPGGPNDRSTWWLPARSVRITDSWSIDPDRVPRGETSRRTVTIEADGVTADQLPPAPKMISAGIISFRGPSERQTLVSNNGPVGRVTYSWDMRPTTAFPAVVTEVRIPYFDTKARTLRDAVIPSRRMAWAAETLPETAAAASQPVRPSPALVAGGGAAAFLLGLGVLTIGAGGLRLPHLPPRELRDLRRAARKGDAAALRAALTALIRKEPERARLWLASPDVRDGVAALDRFLYAASGGQPPELRRLARAIVRARRGALREERPQRSALAPLDGPSARA
jgi:hypothetical protein